MAAPIVFFDIAGPDDAQLSRFYSELFAWDIADDGSVSKPIISPSPAPALLGNIRTDPAEKLLYIGVDDVDVTLQRVVELGGSIDQPRFEVPGTVAIGLIRDPAVNRLRLVELDDGVVKIP
jgi:predicted enzyme related to lactoylglutathione lyase